MTSGYFRYPTIAGENIAFISEDDIWVVTKAGGRATRLTATNGLISFPRYSPCGKFIAFSGQEEGFNEVYVVPAEGGAVKRLTYFGNICVVFGWTTQGEVLFRTAAKHTNRTPILMKVHQETLQYENLNLGPATSVVMSEKGVAALERNSHRPDPAHWKRYRGGTAGKFWVGSELFGEYTEILENVNGNLASPQWISETLYFLSDHEGYGNIYSCQADGSGLTRHTDHNDYYARNLDGDGQTLVYHAGGDIYCFDPETNQSRIIEIDYFSQRPQRQRKFVDARKFNESFNVSPDGARITYGSRGQIFAFQNWTGALYKKGDKDGVRYRLGRWLQDSKTIAVVSDEDNQDQIEIYKFGNCAPEKTLEGDFGRILELKPAPTRDLLALVNNRNELIVVDILDGTSNVIAKNQFNFLSQLGFNWSPDSRWIAFIQNVDRSTTQVQVYDVEEKQIRNVSRTGLLYHSPVFDPKGRYLYFLSHERLNPVYSDLVFELSFPKTSVPCVVPLRKETLSPFVDPFDDDEARKEDIKEEDDKQDEKKKTVSVVIDFDGIEIRVQSFPLKEQLFLDIIPGPDSKVYFASQSPEGALGRERFPNAPAAKTRVTSYDYKLRKEESFLEEITSFSICQGGKHQVIQVKNDIRVTKCDEKPDAKSSKKETNSKTGWIDLDRVKVLVDPGKEWRQMYREIWRLQKEHFWVEDMSNIDWDGVYGRYEPLIDRVGSRSEFSDLAWEMQGELGTSHAYEMGGDLKPRPTYPLGFLGADFKLSSAGNGYEIIRMFDGEVNEFGKRSPLLQPGLNIELGDELVSVDGVSVSIDLPPEALLLNKAKSEVEIGIRHKKGSAKQHTVRTLADDTNLRYRTWVESNRHYVHEQTEAKVGYLHIPDMGPEGYSEFFRNYLRECEKDGLVIDARYNAGGHVSQLILSLLSRKIVGFDQSRWVGVEPYPLHAPAGPMVTLTNQYAGSDGDIFPHAFKLMGLGPVIGKRTWGGVIGIWARNFLADGGITTQPEFSFWFKDVGWGVENYGTDPDIEIDISPQEYLAGKDPQLDIGIEEVLKLIEKNPPLRPNFGEIPDLGRFGSTSVSTPTSKSEK